MIFINELDDGHYDFLFPTKEKEKSLCIFNEFCFQTYPLLKTFLLHSRTAYYIFGIIGLFDVVDLPLF
jgi:hypothetical protein